MKFPSDSNGQYWLKWKKREKLWTSFTAVLPCRLLWIKDSVCIETMDIQTHTHIHTHSLSLSRFLTIKTHSLSSGNHSTHTHTYTYTYNSFSFLKITHSLTHTHYFSNACVSLSFYSFGQFYLELVQRRRKWTAVDFINVIRARFSYEFFNKAKK